MFVVISYYKNRTYGTFATFDEARIWGEDKFGRSSRGEVWYINKVEQIVGTCPVPYDNGLREVSSDEDCC